MSEEKEWVEVEVNAPAEAPKADVTPVVTPEEKEVKEPEEHYGQRARKRIQQLVGNVKDDRKSTRLNSSHVSESRMPSSA